MSRKQKICLVVLGVAVIGLALFRPLNGADHFRRWFMPVAYWTQKRDTAQAQVEVYRDDLRWCMLEFKKLERTRNLNLKQEILSGSAPKEAKEIIQADWKATQIACQFSRELLQEVQEELEIAQQQLKRLNSIGGR